MHTHPVPEIHFMSYITSIVIVPLLFWIIPSSFMKEPKRRTFNAIILAVGGGAYFNSGFGYYELIFGAVIGFTAYHSLNNYKFLALGWLFHTIWDIAHHVTGNPMLDYLPSTSFECAITDFLLAIWFWFNAPTISEMLRLKKTTTT
jgi:Family of unknown function (DUF6010)